jgi:cytochrome c553
MSTKNMVLAALSLAALSVAVTASAHADAPAKPDKVVVCAACHGENGVALQPIYPNLAGQQESYIEHALHAYKNGERKNPIMGAQAGGLSDSDIKQLAVWFSQQPAKVYVPDIDGGGGK